MGTKGLTLVIGGGFMINLTCGPTGNIAIGNSLAYHVKYEYHTIPYICCFQ